MAPGCLAQPSSDLCPQVSDMAMLQSEVCQQVSDMSVEEDGGWGVQDRDDGRKSDLPAVFLSTGGNQHCEKIPHEI